MSSTKKILVINPEAGEGKEKNSKQHISGVQNKKMRIRCIQEVYFEPKMFETIGFHHQGYYSINVCAYLTSTPRQYGFPILVARDPSTTAQDEELDSINQAHLQYVTKIFEVSFNEQEFVFNGGCRFKFQTDFIQGAHIRLVISLVKTNRQGGFRLALVKNGVVSAEEILKNNEEDNKQFSHERIPGGLESETCSKMTKPSMKQIEQQKVSSTQFIIDCSNDSIVEPSWIYQSTLFPDQQYFGKLYFLVAHTKMGYKMRSSSTNFVNFAANPTFRKISSNKHISSSKYHEDRSMCSSHTNKTSLTQILRQFFGGPRQSFLEMIRAQIIQFEKIKDIEEMLLIKYEQKQEKRGKTLGQQIRLGISHLDRSRVQMPLILRRKRPFQVDITIPTQQIGQSLETLLSYYECDSEDELYRTIFEQQNMLFDFIGWRWQYVISLISALNWSFALYDRTIATLVREFQYLSKGRISTNLEWSSQYVGWEPKLKYRNQILSHLPIFFMQTSKDIANPGPQLQTCENVVFVLVHGFNGNMTDMNRIKSFLSFFYNPHFLVLKSISTHITENLDTIGRAAAEEISVFLKIRPFIKRVNFIGFSLGGVIIRSCLKYLKPHQTKFNLLITLSSPHLGVKEVGSCLVQTGLKVLDKIKGVKNIKELLLDPTNANPNHSTKPDLKYNENNMEELEWGRSYLEVLAEDKSMQCFRLVVVVGSHDDMYVPGFSAVLDYDGQDGRVKQMEKSIKSNTKCLHQIYVKFSNEKRGTAWQRVTGRRIHINFLDDDHFLFLFFSKYQCFF